MLTDAKAAEVAKIVNSRENEEDRKDILNRLSEKCIASIIDEAEDKEKYENALKLGLKAFSGEVKFDENQ